MKVSMGFYFKQAYHNDTFCISMDNISLSACILGMDLKQTRKQKRNLANNNQDSAVGYLKCKDLLSQSVEILK